MYLHSSQAKDFRLITEGISPKLVDLDSTIYQPLSCRSIFSNALPLRRLKTSIYLYHCPSDEDSRSCALFFDWKGNPQEFDIGKYHLLMLTHKFPIQQKVCCVAKTRDELKFWNGLYIIIFATFYLHNLLFSVYRRSGKEVQHVR